MKKVKKNGNVREKAVSAINEEPLRIVISRKRYRIWDVLFLRRRKKVFIVRPPVLGVLVKISGILENIRIEKEDIEKQPFEFGIEYLNKNKDDMLRIIGYALHGKEGDPDKGLLKFIDENLTAHELLVLVSAILSLTNVKDFSSSIMLAQSMSLMKSKELIALQKEISGQPSAV